MRLFPTIEFALVFAFTSAATAQDLVPKGAPQTRPVVLRNGVVHTIDRGTFLGGTIWFHEGRIRGVLPAGEAPTLPDGAEPLVVDINGKHVWPGLVGAYTQLGLIELGMVQQTVDRDEIGDLSPEVIAAVAVNPDSTAIPVARTGGILVAGTFPTGGLVPGRASVLQLDGWTNADMALRRDAGVVVDWPAMPPPGGRRGMRGRRGAPPAPGTPGTPAAPGAPGAPEGPFGRRGGGGDNDPAAATKKARQSIDDAFAHARAWNDAHSASVSTAPDLRAEALVPALRGDTPVFLLADELEQIESAVLWATGIGLRPVVVGGRDALLCADLLLHWRVPVVVLGTHKLPRRDDSAYDEPFSLPARLATAGIPFCIATGEEFAHERNLPFHAATAAAFGLDRDLAMASITKNAAEILGVGDRVGTLAAGKDATLMITDGNPLDLTTHVERAWIQGREVDLRNKQTELAKKYREKYRQLQGK